MLPAPAAPSHPDDMVVIDPAQPLVPGRAYRIVIKAGSSFTNVPVAGFSPVTRAFGAASPVNFTAVAP
jgi:hypothetical protein